MSSDDNVCAVPLKVNNAQRNERKNLQTPRRDKTPSRSSSNKSNAVANLTLFELTIIIQEDDFYSTKNSKCC